MVTKIHVEAEKLKNEGYKIVVVGDPNHPEVKGTLSHVPGAVVHRSPSRTSRSCRAAAASASSCSRHGSGTGFTDIVERFSAKYYEVRAVNTICTDTHNRQAEARTWPRGRGDGRRRREDLGQHAAPRRASATTGRAPTTSRGRTNSNPRGSPAWSGRVDVGRFDAGLARRPSGSAHGGDRPRRRGALGVNASRRLPARVRCPRPQERLKRNHAPCCCNV